MLVVVLAVTVLALLLAGTALAAATSGRVTVAAGQTYQVDRIIKLNYLQIAEGGIVKAKPGYSVTMTVNGVETGGSIYVFDTGVVNPPMPPFDPGGPVIRRRFPDQAGHLPGGHRTHTRCRDAPAKRAHPSRPGTSPRSGPIGPLSTSTAASSPRSRCWPPSKAARSPSTSAAKDLRLTLDRRLLQRRHVHGRLEVHALEPEDQLHRQRS